MDSTKNRRALDFTLNGIPDPGQRSPWETSAIHVTLLADIRDTLYELRSELRTLNATFRCPNVQKGFAALRSLAKIERAREKARRERAMKRKVKR